MLEDIIEVLDSKAGLNLNLDSKIIRISLAKEIFARIENEQMKKDDAETIHRGESKTS